jgi:hypothetical protein
MEAVEAVRSRNGNIRTYWGTGAARENEWESKNLPGVWEQQESRNGNINT